MNAENSDDTDQAEVASATTEEHLDRLCELADQRGLASLPQLERTAVLTWWAKALVDNGGFQYFYEGSPDGQAVAQAFTEVGLTHIANAFFASLRAFPNQIPPPDHNLRLQWMDLHSDELQEAFVSLDEIVWGLEPQRLSEVLKVYLKHDP